MRSFLGFGQVAYIGQPYALPIKLAGISGRIIPLLFQWLSYGASSSVPNVNVLVDFDNAACKAFDQIRSVYIDNLGSANPIYIYFPDTNYTVSAKANSEGWYPAFTNAKQFWVIGEGFLNGNIPQTSVIASNIPLSPNVNTEIDQSVALWLASPVISRGNSIYNERLGTPALADQIQAPTMNLANISTIVPLWGTPYASGFIYLNSLVFKGINISGVVLPTQGTLNIESTGVAGILFSPTYILPEQTVTEIFSIFNMNLKLDATQTWRARVTQATANGPIGQLYSSFTQQP